MAQAPAFPPAHGAVYRNTYRPEVLCRVEWYQRHDGRRGWRMVNIETGGTRHTFTSDDARAFEARYVPAEESTGLRSI